MGIWIIHSAHFINIIMEETERAASGGGAGVEGRRKQDSWRNNGLRRREKE